MYERKFYVTAYICLSISIYACVACGRMSDLTMYAREREREREINVKVRVCTYEAFYTCDIY